MSAADVVAPGRLIAAAGVLAAWVGAAALVIVVAQAAFAVLPTRALAGALVGRVLPVIFVAGIVAGVAALGLALGAGGAFGRARLVLPVVAVLACAAAQFGVGPRIQRVRAELGPSVESVPPTDARRREFGRLHGVSVMLMGAGMLAAGAALVLTAVAAARRP